MVESVDTPDLKSVELMLVGVQVSLLLLIQKVLIMKEKFFEYFEGYFNNQKQAFNKPREFAMIELTHTKLNKNRFSVSQKYVIDPEPYRKTIIEILEENNKLIIKNYKNGKNEEYLSGCDIIFEYINGRFHGKNICNECYVQRGIRNTYLTIESILGDGYYHVVDKGFDPETNKQVWGSYHGMFQFDRK